MPSTLSRRTAIRSVLAGTGLLLLIFPLLRSTPTSNTPPKAKAFGTVSRDDPQARARAQSSSHSDRDRGAEGGGRGWWGGGVRDWIAWKGDGVGPLSRDSMGGDGSDEDGWVDFGEGLPVTTYDGGLPGYQVFSNMYVTGSSLLAITPSSTSHHGDRGQDESDSDPELEDQDQDQSFLFSASASAAASPGHRPFPEDKAIISPKNNVVGEERWRVVEEGVGREEVGKRGIRLGGVTYIFNDGPGGVYFRHFVLEAFLGATRVLASTLPESMQITVPRRIWFPRCGQAPSWRDDRGENAWFLAHTLPFASVEDASGWADRNTAGVTLLLDKVVIIDRWASHSAGGEVGKWGKMNAAIPTVSAAKDFWEPFRLNAMRSLGVDGSSETGSRGLPVVVYVDRQKANPKVREADHDALVEALKGLTGVAEIHVARLSAMTKARQVELMGRAQIIIGLHGDEVMTSLWMPAREGSTVIEIFERGGFARDYELLASSLNHRYVAITGDRILEEDEWRAMGAKTGEERQKGEISVDADTVVRVISNILNGGIGSTSVDSGIP